MSVQLRLTTGPVPTQSATTGLTASQVTEQMKHSGHSAVRDSVVRTSQRRDAMRAVGVGIVGTNRMLRDAGATKVASAARKGGGK